MTRRIFSFLMLAAFVIAVTSRDALAFCPMCRTTLEGATGAQQAADSLSLAALVLLAPPVMIFAALFGLFYRLRNASGENGPANEEKVERTPAPALTG
ncbi:MAG: hypothetical protein ACJ74J_19775 [Blastocatellia bacterium]